MTDGDRTVALRCPNCGAPARPEATQCDYCRSPLATVACPKCFGVLFAGSRFCPHCGAARSRVEGMEPVETKCPACKFGMTWVTVGTIDMLECGGCRGTWVEAVAFERLCADRDSQSAIVHPGDTAPPPPRETVIHYRPCLRCGKLMNRVNFAMVSGTIVDVCKGHGTFLDQGELHRVVQFILDGGLDKTRELKREALVQEERRLRELEREQAGLAPSPETHWTDVSLHQFLSGLFEK
jgi:Zn-finger nucleic acid-binding protein